MKRKRRHLARIAGKKQAFLETLEQRQLMTVSVADVTINEDVGTFQVQAVLSETRDSSTSVSFGTSGGAAEGGKDYVIKLQTVQIPAGRLSATAQFQVIEDQHVEGDEDFFITATVSATSESDTATITIKDNDTPTVSLENVTVNEGDGKANVNVALSGPASEDIIVNVFPRDSTAHSGTDFVQQLSSVRIASGQVSGTAEITLVNDAISEPIESLSVDILSAGIAEIAVGTATVEIIDDDLEFRSITGINNNLGSSSTTTEQGAANTNIIRFGYQTGYPDANGIEPDDSTGVFHNGDHIHRRNAPNAREVSNRLMDQDGDLPNARSLSDWIVQWGQFITHEVALVRNGSEHNRLSDGSIANFNIKVPDSQDPLGPAIPFNRSEFDSEAGNDVPREQVNAVTSYIDASVVYGSDEIRANALRTFSGGRLKTSNGNLPPLNTDGLPVDTPSAIPDTEMFLVGDERGTEATGLVATHTVFLREHNRLANIIEQNNPSFTDEQIYQWARRIVSAEIQKITYEEFLPALMGEEAAPDPNDYEYDPKLKADVTNSFTTAFFRFGHSMQSSRLLLVDDSGTTVDSLSLAQIFNRPDLVKDNPEIVGQALKGLATQVAQENDVFLVDEIRNFLFGPPGAGGLDLGALDIQRGRDHGLLPMNELRVAYKLPPLVSPSDPSEHPFSGISSDKFVQETLASLYDSIDEVDAFVGGIAEDHVPGSSVGPTLQNSFQDQFSRLRDGDRFFYTGDKLLQNEVVVGAVDLETRTLANIIRDNTDIQQIQENVFFTELPKFDFGDAGSGYPTVLNDNGARHLTVGPQLGPTRTAEQNANLNDQGDDGVDFSQLLAGQTASLSATLQGAEFARLDAWIDFNRDGDWSDVGEQIASSALIFEASASTAIEFDVPASAVAGSTAARVRLSSSGGLLPIGFASDGEVEDYVVNIATTGNPTKPDAMDDSIVASNSEATSISSTTLLANDFDADGETISIASFDATSAMGARISADGVGGFNYDPTSSETLSSLPLGGVVEDSFHYTISDTGGRTDTASVSIRVSGTQPPPPFPSFNYGDELGEISFHDVDLGDLDGDGDLDALATSQTGPDSVWINLGGTYTDTPSFIINQDQSIYSALGDIDLDGDLDVVIAATTEVAVWKNDGAAKFTKHASYEIGSALDVAIGDLNGDGYPDVYVARSEGPDRLIFNNGFGSFFDSGLQLANGTSKSVELGDIDGDGDLDAVIGSQGANTVWKNEGFGFFQDTGQRLGNHFTEHLAMGDLDSDGDLDLYAANSGRGEPNIAYFNDGSGSYSASQQQLGNAVTSHVVLADFDRDGDLDALTGNWFFEEDRIWSNLGNGTFVASGIDLPGRLSSHIATGDIDQDGDIDAIFANFAQEPNRIWYNSPQPPEINSQNYELTFGQPWHIDLSESSDPQGRPLVFQYKLQGEDNFRFTAPESTIPWDDFGASGRAPGTYEITFRARAVGSTDFSEITKELAILALPTAIATAPTITSQNVSSQVITVTYSHDASIDASDIGANDIEVVLPNGSVRRPSFLTKSTNSDEGTITATYRLNSLGSFYSVPDSGKYTIRMRSNQVRDTYGAYVPPGEIGDFEVNIDAIRPQATIGTYRAPAYNVQHSFEVTYTDNVQIDIESLGTGNILLRRPNRQSFAPEFISSSSNAAGNVVTATYGFEDPDGFDVGTYEAIISGGQVSDTSGNVATGKTLGEISLYQFDNVTDVIGYWPTSGGRLRVESVIPVNAAGFDFQSANSQLSGGNDAAPFDFFIAGQNQTNIARATLGSLGKTHRISPIIVLDIAVEQGAPRDSITGIWGNGPTPVNFPVVRIDPGTASATAADIAGASRSSQLITVIYDGTRIDASDIGAGDIEVVLPNGQTQRPTFVSQSSNSNVSSISATYRLDAPGGFYTRLDNGNYSIRLRTNEVTDVYEIPIASGEIGSFKVNVDDLAPTAQAVAEDINQRNTAFQQIRVTYSDNVGIDQSGIGTGDIEVVLPNGTTVVPSFLKSTTNTNGSVAAIYRLDAPGGFYDSLENGTYRIRMRPQEVSDPSGNVVASQQIGSFQVSVDDVAPTASALAADISTQLAFQTITVTYTDNFAIATPGVGAGDIEVLLPSGSVVRPQFISRSTDRNSTAVTATYRLFAPGGFYDALDNGEYVIRMRANQVLDTTGLPVPQSEIGRFDVLVDSDRPTAVASADDIVQSNVSQQTITITYQDDFKVDASTIGAGDIDVISPTGSILTPTFISRSSDDATSIDARYRITAPGGFYDRLDNGTYRIRVRENQVSDISGKFVLGEEVGSFTIGIPVPITTANDTVQVHARATHSQTNQASINVLANDTSTSSINVEAITELLVDGTWQSISNSNEQTIAGNYGTLVWQANGEVSYVTNTNKPKVQNLPTGETLTESFRYVVNNNTTTADAVLEIRINGVWELKTPLVPSPETYGGEELSVESLMGDYDSDGDLDVFVSQYNGPDQIWLNDGRGQFVDSGQRLGNGQSIYGANGDIDGDGDLDLIVASFDENKVWLNDGRGHFTDSGQVLGDPSVRSYSVALGDVNGDTFLDAVIGNQSSEFVSDWIFLNDGSGNFTPKDANFGWYQTTSVSLGDLDRDDDLDLVISSQTTGANQFLLNDGHGNFTDSLPQVIDATQWGDVPYRKVRNNIRGTVRNNQDLDAEFKLHWNSENLYVLANVTDDILFNDGDDHFVEDDGVSVYIDGGNEKARQYDENDHNFSFKWKEETVKHNGQPASSQIRKAERRTHDGYIMEMSIPWDVIGVVPAEGNSIGIDIHVNDDDDGGLRDKKITWHGLVDDAWWNPSVLNAYTLPAPCQGGCQFDLLLEGPYAANAEHVELGDIDGDGDLDLVDASSDSSNGVWINQGDGRFVDTGQRVGESTTSQVVLVDLDLDGDLDLFEGNWTNNSNKVWLNDGDGTFIDTGIRYDQEIATEHVSFGDIDGDGDPDAFVSAWGASNRVYVNTLNQAIDPPQVIRGAPIAGEDDFWRVEFDQPIDTENASIEFASTAVESVRLNPRSIESTATGLTADLQGIPAGEYQVSISGVTNLHGVALDGNNDGQPGGSYQRTVFVTWKGDADLDGDVDFRDFLILSTNFGKQEATWTDANFDGDDGVDFSDFLRIATLFGAAYEPTSQVDVVFHLDFENEIRDKSGNDLPISVGSSVRVSGDGPEFNNRIGALRAGEWAGTNSEANQILILDHPKLDEVATSAGAIVTWIKVDDDNDWNNIVKTSCPNHVEPCGDAFGPERGIELQSRPSVGIFGAVQGWRANSFGPNFDPTGATDTPTGVWTHVALAWDDNGQQVIYVNGTPSEPTDLPNEFGANNPGNWTIGGDGLDTTNDGIQDPNSRRLEGRLADFAILKGNLDAEDIDEIMRVGVGNWRW